MNGPRAGSIKISSSQKFIFQGLGYALLIFLGWLAFKGQAESKIAVFIGVGFVWLLLYFTFKLLYFSHADAVYDEGDFLWVQKNGLAVRIALKDIKDVSYFSISGNHMFFHLTKEATYPWKKVGMMPTDDFKTNGRDELIERIEKSKLIK